MLPTSISKPYGTPFNHSNPNIMKNFISIIKFYLALALLNPFTLAGLISGCHEFTFFGFVVSALACSVLFLGGGAKAFK
jgi:hypothetical protein